MIGRIVAFRQPLELRIVRARDGRWNYGPAARAEKLALEATGAYATQAEVALDCAKRLAAAINAEGFADEPAARGD